ncbi:MULTISPECIES: FtsX-like permease family protein [unclassified Methanoregula]|uniref:ABC transporter permease n=1 Tax=unclassified Methanoregula TaxID=2649730 RepID=UPI0009CD35CB|nr:MULTISPECIES: FtsX-like permease family protein [unclassified Methanoregula]OPX65117.1 MAG: FtsX-like permease family protein [Methanoregula sp. PtaB.Bin085]OPY32029.1 MAG: FtsX-like permease family protein [Methanoregula sp. PtaU1.Bin006]
MDDSKDLRFFTLVRSNISNRPYRNIATIFAFACIAATLFSSQYLVDGAQESLDSGMSRMGADILVVPEEYAAVSQTIILNGQPSSFFFDETNLEKISRVSGVGKASPQIYIATLFASCCAAPVQMIAIDPENDFTISAWLKENPEMKLGKDEIIIGSAVIQNVGNDLMFYGHTFHVVGILKQTGMGVDNSVFTRFEDAYVMADESELKAVKKLSIPPGKISAVLVKVEPGYSPQSVAQQIQENVPGTKTITPNGLLNTVNSQLAAIRHLLFGTTLAITLVSVPLLGFISAMVAHERRKEVAIIRALGAPKGFVIRLMLAESFSLAIIGGIIGIGAAALILVLFQDHIALSLKIPFIIPSVRALLVEGGTALLLCAGIGGISSVYPAILINRSDPYETIRKGES